MFKNALNRAGCGTVYSGGILLRLIFLITLVRVGFSTAGPRIIMLMQEMELTQTPEPRISL